MISTLAGFVLSPGSLLTLAAMACCVALLAPVALQVVRRAADRQDP